MISCVTSRYRTSSSSHSTICRSLCSRTVGDRTRFGLVGGFTNISYLSISTTTRSDRTGTSRSSIPSLGTRTVRNSTSFGVVSTGKSVFSMVVRVTRYYGTSSSSYSTICRSLRSATVRDRTWLGLIGWFTGVSYLSVAGSTGYYITRSSRGSIPCLRASSVGDWT